MEEKIMTIANRLGNQKHLRAIRNAFMYILPITMMGGLCAVLSSAPVTDKTTNSFLLAWGNFVSANSMIFSWINTLTLGAIAIYLAIAISYNLCRHYKIDPIIPVLLSITGVMMLTINPQKLAFDGKVVEISYIDGKGILVGIFVGIVTVELFRFLKEKEFGVIRLPDNVPGSLSQTFASLATSMVIMILYIIIFTIFNKCGTTLAIWLTQVIAPAVKGTDSLWFILFMVFIINLAWLFGIHNATFWGLMGPIMYMSLSANAGAQMANQALPSILTESFWAYFICIGGTGQVLSLAILLCLSKHKELKTVGRLGIAPAFFGISEPIVFGLPMMLNPIYLIPGIGTGLVNATLAYLAMSTGLIHKTYAMLSWNMPSIFGAWLSTGDFKALVVIVICLVLDILIYLPFVKMNERQLKKESEANPA
ncbi:PTS transporter subunit EIIC [Clostridium sp. KNHs216]|uniref:PTS sugar transporter subunit IIC n=1 Tax=Clostridium sp. KNHs216 TaxID=1550235 RepID=UPI001150CC75|nr:PTS transporter subunit EIIC [Clostridium sp. KNHs216]TQI66037.1 PTS system cellobiose-specific IIC component [Clostridium sp. KNHs216]